MNDMLLVLNSGSSSVKFSVFSLEDDNPIVRGKVEGLGTSPKFELRDRTGESIEHQDLAGQIDFDHDQSIRLIFEKLKGHLRDDNIVAVGHRIVHGGTEYAAPVLIDQDVVKGLEKTVPLAPLHQPHSVAAIKAIFHEMPHLPQVACFDTAFHRSQPEIAQWFGLPRRYTDQGIRRYGFHGLSYEFIASMLPKVDPRAATGRTIVAHLGNGSSMCAIHAGRSIATTMSFTPVDGLLMGTRVGSLDPGALLYLMTSQGLDSAALEKLIYQESGLLGVSGLSSDMRTLLASTEQSAVDAINLFVYRFGREFGSLVAALGGLDALVFTGGIGENSAAIRSRICRDAAWIGLSLDEAANEAGSSQISDPNSKAAVWIIATNEELMIAQHTRQLLRVCRTQ